MFVFAICALASFRFLIYQKQTSFTNPILFKYRKAIAIQILKHLAISSRVYSLRQQTDCCLSFRLKSQFSKPLFERPKNWNTMQLNSLNVFCRSFDAYSFVKFLEHNMDKAQLSILHFLRYLFVDKTLTFNKV